MKDSYLIHRYQKFNSNKMRNIYQNLYIGNQEDFEDLKSLDDSIWAFIHACKEPYHRELLGYTTRSVDQKHPEYLYAIRGDTLYMNLVDAPDPKFFSKELIFTALEFINDHIENQQILIHCNQGESRAPGIGLLYLVKIGVLTGSLEEIEEQFKELYPEYNPGAGMKGFIEQHIK